ncbi:glycosyltransferase family 9 protein [Bordetella hinzii]|uniref:Heptosyltransferase n=1 Tax=Bordetella hinzii TaxID=103855 RepID=A0AAN1RY69_9BORD|nr:glycosyltransferase family 9 protein [Bordetella hinzii]AKQ60828.1 ADP-heptose--LPS heptosyltransferase 2 [Bordetella hinzii]AZW18154.1 heptosyltransferase [Bordetella hinzii]KCB48870.1 heptosyltransferase [Bordetella hinzii 4161]MBZ0076150.1 heptosyltransferase [Bordetella hinzii]MBZ0080574.1 heptosyltransferase [Bordetella hinzii]
MSALSTLYVRVPNWVGDVCMSLPSLRLLQASGLPLVICARPWARDLLDGLSKADFLPMTGKWRSDRATVARHRRGQARGLLLPDSLSSAAVFRLAGVPSAGYRDDGRSLLLRWPVNKPAQAMHAVQSWYYLTRQALKAWGLPEGDPEPGPSLDLPLTERHRNECEAALARAGLGQRPFVLIAPTATGLHRGKIKVWPQFDALTRALQGRGHTVVMCPPAPEVEEARRNAPTASLLPPLGLGAFACLTARASLVICNDSGVSHVAAAAGARELALFGVTRRERTGPWSARAVCLGAEGAWPSLAEVEDSALAQLRGSPE